MEADGAILSGGSLHLKVTVDRIPDDRAINVKVFAGNRHLRSYQLRRGEHQIKVPGADLAAGTQTVQVVSGSSRAQTRVRVIPAWFSVIPPLVAIGLALIFKEVLVSLFFGIFVGALFLAGGSPFGAFGRTIDHFVVNAITDSNHAKILIFSTLLGGMVGLISRSGGTRGIVERLIPYATSSRRGQLATWVMGILIFFDDYANTLIVGSTMRPIADRLKISREKLAYIVDSTAAPIASVVPISTWIGFELGLIGDAFKDAGIAYSPFATFIASIPYRFYPIFALVLGFTIAASRRDFGPMLRAERRARKTGQVLAKEDTALADYEGQALEPDARTPLRAFNALIPIATVSAVTLAGLFRTGSAGLARADFDSTGAWLREVFAASASYDALLWASLSGVVVAAFLALVQRLLSLKQTVQATLQGFKAMLMALIVLILAWSIGSICTELHTADYLVGLSEGILTPHWIPVLVFVLSAAVAFATGSSWSTMAILFPLVIPVLHSLSVGTGPAVDSEAYFALLAGTVSSVLAGSVWGDHCSPISDTTILSSMASGSDHIAHVRTQLPYALAIGVLGMLIGDIPTAWGLSPWISILLGSGIIIGGVLWLGQRSDGEGGDNAAEIPPREPETT